MLDRLWNDYWLHTLASSPLLSNQDFINKSITDIVKKMNEFSASHFTAGTQQKRRGKRGGGDPNMMYADRGAMLSSNGGAGPSSKIDLDKFEPLERESSNVAIAVSSGMLMEFLKKFMFAA